MNSTCNHATTAVRYKTSANNRRMWCRQCQECGERVGDWLAHSNPDVLALAEAVPFDEAFQETNREARYVAQREALIERSVQWREVQNERLAAERAAKEAEWQVRYQTYLQSAEWRAKRALVMKRADYICEGCGLHPATDVHHLSYEHMGGEFLWELRAVCRPCHTRWHSKDQEHAA